MKKLITLLAVLGVATTATADDHMKQSGSFRVLYQADNNRTDQNDDAGDRTSNIQQRLIWGPHFKVSDNLSVHATLNHAANWGTNADQVPGNGASTSTTDGEDQGNVLIVNEAYANWMVDDESMIRVGRGSFTMADGRVVAANNWEQVRKAFDGIMYTRDMEALRGSVFAVRGSNLAGGAAVVNNNAGNFYGVNLDFKSLPDFLKTANLHYVMIKVDDDATFAEEDTTRLGITVGGDTAGIDYNVTYAMYSGEYAAPASGGANPNDIDASMYDVTVGYSMPDMMNLRVSAQIHSDTGDDNGTVTGDDRETYTGFHYDAHNNAGLMDIFGYGNLTFTRVGVTLDPQEDITFGLDYYMFTKTEDTDAAYAPFNSFGTGGASATVANASVANEDDLGTEIDVWVTKNYSSNFSTTLRYGQFSPGDAFASDDNVTQLYLEGMMTF